MVWNTTQSSLYRAVSDYNNEISRRENNSRAESASEYDNSSSDGCSEKKHGSPKSQTRAAKRCSKCANCANCPHHHSSPNDNFPNFGGLNIDRDFLLLAGLIFILSENGADKKLIAALAIALLG